MDLSGATWRKSTRSGTGGGGSNDCVELAVTQEVVGVRDTKNPGGAILKFSPQAMNRFFSSGERVTFDD